VECGRAPKCAVVFEKLVRDLDVWGVYDVNPTAAHFLSGSANAQLQPAVAASHSQFMVVWADTRVPYFGIYGRMVSDVGQPCGSALPVTIDFINPGRVVASDGVGFAVAWEADDQVKVRRVALDGTSPDPTPLFAHAAPENQGSAAIVFNGASYTVAFEHAV